MPPENINVRCGPLMMLSLPKFGAMSYSETLESKERNQKIEASIFVQQATEADTLHKKLLKAGDILLTALYSRNLIKRTCAKILCRGRVSL